LGLALHDIRQLTLANLSLFFFIGMTQAFRCVYLALFTSGELQTENEISYVLVEPPSFFVLTAASILILSYGFCFYCVKRSIPQASVYMRFWIIWSLFTVLLYALMVVVIALESTVYNRISVYVDCYGLVNYKENSNSVQKVRIVYHSILLLFAVFAAVFILFLGRGLQQEIMVDYLLLISIICGVSVFSTNIMWVIYSALSASTPYFVIPLWICECPPLVLICFLARPKVKEEPSE
jgi:hypothetical protein